MKNKWLVSVSLLLLVAMASHAADLIPMIPQDAAFVLNIDVTKFVKLPEIQKQIEEGIAKSKERAAAADPKSGKKELSYDEFVAKSGFDPIKHVENIMIYVPMAAAKENKPEPGVLVGGTFDEAKIVAFLQGEPDFKKDAAIEKFYNLTAIKSLSKEKEGMGVFLAPTAIALGKEEALEKIVAVKTGKDKNILANAAFGQLLKSAKTDAMMWGVGQMTKEIKESIAKNPQYAQFSHVNSIFFSFNYGNDIDLAFTCEVDQKENLEQVVQGLQGFVQMFKMFPGVPPEAIELLNLVSVKGEGATNATISWKVAKAKLEDFKAKMKKRIEQGGMPGAGSPMMPPAGGAEEEE